MYFPAAAAMIAEVLNLRLLSLVMWYHGVTPVRTIATIVEVVRYTLQGRWLLWLVFFDMGPAFIGSDLSAAAFLLTLERRGIHSATEARKRYLHSSGS